MHIELKRIDGSVIFGGEAVSLIEVVGRYRADLSGANLWGADLRQALIGNPSRLLEAFWGDASDDLCCLLMAYDAANHPKGREAFTAWAAGGKCPYSDVRVSRAANFIERRNLWDADAPVLSAYELMVRLVREKCANSDFHAEMV